MRAHITIKTPSHQKGLALVILVVIVLLTIVAYYTSNLSITQVRTEQIKSTMATLKRAKRAIINHAITYADEDANKNGKFGVLPHPETTFSGNDGNMPPNWGTKNTNIVEWFPWRSLDLPTLKDESGTCLFYAVSGTYKLGGTVQSDMINEDSIGMFQVVNSAGDILQGANIEDRVVVLVIAPGGPLVGQARNPLVATSSCGRDYANVGAYLEGDGVTDNSAVSAVADTIDQFIGATETSADEAVPYNDRFLTITRGEIWKAIIERSDFKQKMENLTQAMALCLAEYANAVDNTSRRLPWPVITSLGATTNYRDKNNYDDDNTATQGYSGRFPFNVGDSNDAINPGALTDDDLLDIPGLCSNIILTSGPDIGTAIDLDTATSEYRKLWKNWKDHFFYILSKGYGPDNTGENTCALSGACVTVNATEYAGAVIFSGSRLDGITRNDKSVVSDYLEDGKGNEFIEEAKVVNQTGDRTYVYTDPQTDTQNDVMYCISDEAVGLSLTVSECI